MYESPQQYQTSKALFLHIHQTYFNLDTALALLILSVQVEVSAVGKISDCQPEGPGLNPRPGRGLNFRRPSFATPSVDSDVKPLVKSSEMISKELKITQTLLERVGK